MKSVDVANCIIDRYGADVVLTNLKLNELVYFTQVCSLRETGNPLFDDAIEAEENGATVPAVYRAFQKYGRNRIRQFSPYENSERLQRIVALTMDKIGRLTAYDLVQLSRRDGGAWKKAYAPNKDNPITAEIITSSTDMTAFENIGRTLRDGFDMVAEKWPNTMRLLENS